MDRALDLTIDALRLDPDLDGAHLLLFDQLTERGMRAHRAYVERGIDVTNRALAACLEVLLEQPAGDPGPAFHRMREVEERFGPSECSRMHVGRWMLGRVPDEEVIQYLSAAVQEYERSAALWSALGSAWLRSSRPEDAVDALARGTGLIFNPLQRLFLSFQLAAAHLSAGDTAAADAVVRTLGHAVTRRPRAGLAYEYQLLLAGYRQQRDGGLEEVDRMYGVAGQIARRTGAWPKELRVLDARTRAAIDRGRHADALALTDRFVYLADSADSRDRRVTARMLRGSALTRLGRAREGERVLAEAVALARHHDVDRYTRAEASHSLMHAYEGLGMPEEAGAAARAFMGAARRIPFSGIHVISLHDGGTSFRRLGWNAAANETFDELVQVVDSIRGYRYWAGEYFEGRGELRRALRYYGLGVAGPGPNDESDRPRLLAGLARVYARLGMPDSAEWAAREHDRDHLGWGPRQMPLAPAMLERAGRYREGALVADEWAALQERGGNLLGGVLAKLLAAQLRLEAGDLGGADRSATAAESLSIRLHLDDERATAMRVRGEVALRRRRVGDAVRILERAMPIAASGGSDTTFFDAHVALARAYASTGQVDEALAAFDAAASTVEAIAGDLTDPLDRVRFRDRHAAPYDGAVAALLRYGGRARLSNLVNWSARRKTAALSAATGDGPGRDAGWRIDLAALQRTLTPDEIVLDYTVLDSGVTVLVIAADTVTVRTLPGSSLALRELVVALNAPLGVTYRGMLDLGRSEYRLDLAHQLYMALLAPLADLLAGRTVWRIVPDVWLFRIPFEALVTGGLERGHEQAEYHAASYVLDRVHVEYALAIREPASNQRPYRPPAVPRAILVIGGDAPGVDRELAGLARATRSWERVVLLSGTATETAVRGQWDRYSVLHLATHAIADDRDPAGSHLALVPDDRNDGYLHVSEIITENLGANLVVLSACETVAGPVYQGAGLMGLARAFLVAGADHVIASRWPVGPSTASLMEDLYRRVSAGVAPPAALHAAQRALRNRRSTAHPFYWAGFSIFRN